MHIELDDTDSSMSDSGSDLTYADESPEMDSAGGQQDQFLTAHARSLPLLEQFARGGSLTYTARPTAPAVGPVYPLPRLDISSGGSVGNVLFLDSSSEDGDDDARLARPVLVPDDGHHSNGDKGTTPRLEHESSPGSENDVEMPASTPIARNLPGSSLPPTREESSSAAPLLCLTAASRPTTPSPAHPSTHITTPEAFRSAITRHGLPPLPLSPVSPLQQQLASSSIVIRPGHSVRKRSHSVDSAASDMSAADSSTRPQRQASTAGSHRADIVEQLRNEKACLERYRQDLIAKDVELDECWKAARRSRSDYAAQCETVAALQEKLTDADRARLLGERDRLNSERTRLDAVEEACEERIKQAQSEVQFYKKRCFGLEIDLKAARSKLPAVLPCDAAVAPLPQEVPNARCVSSFLASPASSPLTCLWFCAARRMGTRRCVCPVSPPRRSRSSRPSHPSRPSSLRLLRQTLALRIRPKPRLPLLDLCVIHCVRGEATLNSCSLGFSSMTRLPLLLIYGQPGAPAARKSALCAFSHGHFPVHCRYTLFCASSVPLSLSPFLPSSLSMLPYLALLSVHAPLHTYLLSHTASVLPGGVSETSPLLSPSHHRPSLNRNLEMWFVAVLQFSASPYSAESGLGREASP